MAKLWTGRIAGKTDPQANDFNSSISFDQRLYAQDIQGSKVHSSMLAKQGIITTEEKENPSRSRRNSRFDESKQN